MNQTVLMSGVEHFGNGQAINAYMHASDLIDLGRAADEHASIRVALENAGVTVLQTPSPPHCQDGVYTANWALCRGDKAVMARLPSAREAEQPYAEKTLQNLGKVIVTPPANLRFSGQGDALPCGNYLLAGTGYRTDPAMHQFLADALGYDVISLQTIPALDDQNVPVINQASGWPDSFFYDIDLALAVLRPDLIAWCPQAFTPDSQDKIAALPLQKIEVSLEEAMEGFACNLVSTGIVAVMSAHAPQLKAAIEAAGLTTVTPEISELAKGGGYIRCTTLTLDNI